MSDYETKLKTILENLVYDKQVNDALDCIQELNEEYNMEPSDLSIVIGGTHPYAAFQSEDGEIRIIGPPLDEFGKPINMKSSEESYEKDAEGLARKWKLNKRWDE